MNKFQKQLFIIFCCSRHWYRIQQVQFANHRSPIQWSFGLGACYVSVPRTCARYPVLGTLRTQGHHTCCFELCPGATGNPDSTQHAGNIECRCFWVSFLSFLGWGLCLFIASCMVVG